ncbi:MAG: hypothetical protein IKZ13_08935 [Akkermansia sp.]|nr:hypothetical protein [Akkermansia sp.]
MPIPYPAPSLCLLLSTLLCLTALPSCIRTDIGNTIDSIGRQVAKPHPERVLPEGHPDVSDTSPCDCIVKLYRKDGRLYIEMPLVYVTERRCGFEYEGLIYSSYGVATCNRPYSREELAKLPQENIVIALHSNWLYRKTGDIYRLTEAEQFTPRPRSDKQARGVLQIADPDLTFSVTENVDLQSAEYLGSYHFYEARQVAQLLPVRRTWYNYALMPLQAIGYVADVPLSIVTMTLTLPFAGVLSPHLDYTTTNQPERSDSYIKPWHRYDN